ncbi:MAG: hypothetical protein JW812_02845 [Alphaproteobacteria bacterium]|nr:hypothetical protein [Alphaproteobacteria bacterium]MBN2779970.1 hypothetical protein [Alphaproteobacteria bacterium]
MKYILILGAILFSTNVFLPVSAEGAKAERTFFCTTTDDSGAEPTAFKAIFKQISFFAEYVKIAIYIYCVVMGLKLLTFAAFGPFIQWNKIYPLFLIFIVTLFVSTVLKIYAGEDDSMVQTYIDIRRPGILFKECDRSARGSLFIPARFVRKTTN